MPDKRIALLARQKRTNELVDWVERNFETLGDRKQGTASRSWKTALRREMEALPAGGTVATFPISPLSPLGFHRSPAVL
jgi:hypothetical protein